jgi:hypothetical protein
MVCWGCFCEPSKRYTYFSDILFIFCYFLVFTNNKTFKNPQKYVKTVKKTIAPNTQKVATTTKQGATSTRVTTTVKTNATQEVAKPTLLEKIKRFFFGSSY